MTRSIKSAALLLICILTAVPLLSSCGKQFSISCRMGEYPVSLDPQVASNRVQLTIAGNAFEGLLRLGADGKPSAGAAESWTVSTDGLTYTFKLKNDLTWSNGDNLTADDFVFGLERATLASTKAAYGYLLKSIRGAADRLSGKDSPLGVHAQNEGTVEITLASPDDGFLYALCHPVASPCPRSYFNDCGGKYGIGAKMIISNGVYKISYTAENEKVRISKNAKYNGLAKAKCTSVDFSFKAIAADKNLNDLIAKGSWDITEADGAAAAAAKAAGMNTFEYCDSAYYLLFNPSSVIFKKPEIRTAFASLTSFESIDGTVPMTTLLPKDLTLCNYPLSEVEGLSEFEISVPADSARQLFLKNAGNSLLEALNGSFLLTEDDPFIVECLKPTAAAWQKELGAYINIKAESAEGAAAAVRSGNYSVAFVKISSSDLSAKQIIGDLYEMLGRPEKLKSAAESVEKASSLEDAIMAVNSFSLLLRQNGYAVPVFSIPAKIVYDSKYSGISVNEYGYIDFSLINEK